MTSDRLYLTIDMINDFIHPDGSGGRSAFAPEAARRGIIAKTQRLIERARQAGTRIAHARVGFSDDYRECAKNSPAFVNIKKNQAAKLGTWGHEIHAEIKPRAEDFLITKHRISAFYGTELDMILRSHGIATIYISGITTVAGVQSAVRDAHDRDYRVFVIEDCCASLDQAEHDSSIAMLSRLATIVTSATVDFGSS